MIIFAFMMFTLALIVLNPIAVAQQGICNGSIVMDLTPSSQVWRVPHVYQGDNNGEPVKSFPTYYGPGVLIRVAGLGYLSISEFSSLLF